MTDGVATPSATQNAVVPREHFPILGRVTYLNTASFGLAPLPVQSVAREFDEQIWGSGTVGFDDEAEALVYDGAREAVGRLLGCQPDCVAIVGSVTEAIGQIAWALRPGADENVVSTNIEFPSVTYPWLRVSEDSGAEVRLVDVLDDPTALTIDRVAELVDAKTAVVCISHVQYGSGTRLDPVQLAELAHAHGAVLVLDAYQSSGVVPLDVVSTDVDFLVAGGMKWLCGIPGAAFCYLRPELVERFRPGIVGWRSPENPPEFDARDIRLAPGARRMEFATMAYSAGLALGRAIDYILDAGIDRVLEHNLALGTRLMDGMEALGAVLQTPRDGRSRAGVVNVRFRGRSAAEVTRRLNEAGVIVSPRLGGTRFSLHMFNNADDVDRCLEVVERLLDRPA